jgi:hypothetical protein
MIEQKDREINEWKNKYFHISDSLNDNLGRVENDYKKQL